MEALELKHCDLTEQEWEDLLRVCTGHAKCASGLCFGSGGSTTKSVPSKARKRKWSSDSEDGDEMELGYQKQMRHGEEDLFDLACVASSKNLGVQDTENPPQDTGQNSPVDFSLQCNACSASCSALDTSRPMERNYGLRTLSIYQRHSLDFSGLLGGSLRNWPNLQKLELWQPDVVSCKLFVTCPVTWRRFLSIHEIHFNSIIVFLPPHMLTMSMFQNISSNFKSPTDREILSTFLLTTPSGMCFQNRI